MTRTDMTTQLRYLRLIQQQAMALSLDLPKAHTGFSLVDPDGLGTGTDNDRSSKGGHSDRTGEAATAFIDIDGPDETMTDLDMAIKGAFESLKWARQRATSLASLASTRSAHRPSPGQGWCEAHCGHWCPGTVEVAELHYTDPDTGEKITRAGTPEDRLRSGLCKACDAWSRRNGRPDRSEVIRERRGNEGTCGCDDCKANTDVYRTAV